MLELNKLCMGCMRETDGEKICPYCGFSLEKHNGERSSCALPVYTILNGKYLVGKVLGEGGFGITYLAYDLNLQIPIAIKEYFPSGMAIRDASKSDSTQVQVTGSANQEYFAYQLRKFRQEGITLAKFQEMQGVVSVIDFFLENGTGYLVMEFIDGIQMKDYLRQQGGRISEKETLKMMRPLLEMLARVHKEGIIHRDISADNIMITRNREVKLIDFGAARQTTNLTGKSLTVLLKHGYAPVEQYQTDGNQGPWTDVYALCALMYRMISGKLPTTATNRVPNDLLQPLSQMSGIQVSAKTSAAIEKGLSVWAQDRYQNVEALLEALYGNRDSYEERESMQQEREARETEKSEGTERAEHGKNMSKFGRALTMGAIAFAGAFVVFALGTAAYMNMSEENGVASGFMSALFEEISDVFSKDEPPAEEDVEEAPDGDAGDESDGDEEIVKNPEVIGYADMIFNGAGGQEIRKLSGAPVKFDDEHKMEVLMASESSTLGNEWDFESNPAEMFDGDVNTGWNMVSQSSKVEATFDGEREVEYLTLNLGKWGNEEEFRAYSRPQRVKIGLGDMTFEIGFNDKFRKCYLQVSPPVYCSSMSVQVMSNYAGTQTGESCISEIALYGGYEE